MPSEEQMRAAMQAYLDAVNARDAAAATALFANAGTTHDPVGTGVADAHRRLPEMIGQIPEGSTFTLDTPIRTSYGSGAAMAFTLRTVVDGAPVEIRSLDVMEFDEQGLITHMDAYSGPSDTTPAPAGRSTALDGFEDGYADVNGTRLHYVIGGRGEPLVLMDGFPRTWHSLREIVVPLAQRYRVIAVEYRGQGDSAKPAGGYDKKTMAEDVHQLVRHLGYDSVNIAAGDMGGLVAWSFAANHPEATRKLALWEAGPFTPVLQNIITAFPEPGRTNTWWYPLSQIEGLPAKLLAGRFRPLIDWAAEHLAVHPERITEEARAVYAEKYDSPEAVAAAFGTYGAFHQDVADNEAYAPLTMPVLGLGGKNIAFLEVMVAGKVEDIRYVEIADTGHYVAEEQPEALVAELEKFFG